MCIISELAGSADSFLNIDIGTAKLFDFLLKSILHKVIARLVLLMVAVHPVIVIHH